MTKCTRHHVSYSITKTCNEVGLHLDHQFPNHFGYRSTIPGECVPTLLCKTDRSTIFHNSNDALHTSLCIRSKTKYYTILTDSYDYNQNHRRLIHVAGRTFSLSVLSYERGRELVVEGVSVLAVHSSLYDSASK